MLLGHLEGWLDQQLYSENIQFQDWEYLQVQRLRGVITNTEDMTCGKWILDKYLIYDVFIYIF